MDAVADRRMRVAVLGPVLIEGTHGALIEPPGALARSFIVALALAPLMQLSVAGLVEDLWGDAPPRNEKAALHTLVSRLRATSAGELIASTNNGYRLAMRSDECDLGAAGAHRDRAQHAATQGDHDAVIREACAALALWRGEPAADLGNPELAATLSAVAAGLRGELLRIRAIARLNRGDAAAALEDLQEPLRLTPLDEDLHVLRMRALAASGHRNEAVRAFAEFRTRLSEELGTNPSAELVRVNAELLQDEEPTAQPGRIRIGLRNAPNELVGRAADVAAVTELLGNTRLTTVLGVGGLGKTRLAQEVAHRAAATSPAVVVVELAGVRTGEDVPLALASTLGIGEATASTLKRAELGARRDARSRILSALAAQPTLLVMDNCEHLIDAAAAWIADILASTTTVRVLATSRAPLQIGAEHVYPLAPLASRSSPNGADDADSLPPAVALFLERARAARPAAALPIDTVARLCERLDGLPLAIELAAARIRTMSLEEIEERLGNRFALLTGGDRTAPERHRTLLAVIGWSWNLLGASEQRTLRRLARFPDGFGADAARAVATADDTDASVAASASADHADRDLESLVNQSLVSVTDSPRTGSARYRMVETVREFGERELASAGEDSRVTAAMDRWACAFATQAWRTTYGQQQVPTFARVNEEQDTLLAVLRSAIAGRRGDVIVTVYLTLALHWSIRGAHSEVMSLSPAIMHGLEGYHPDAAHREVAIGTWAVIAGTAIFVDPRRGMRALAHMRSLARGHVFVDKQLGLLMQLLLNMNDLDEALHLLTAHRGSEEPLIAAFANVMTAQFYENRGEIDLALQCALAGYENAARAGDTWLMGMSATTLAQLHSQSAHPDEAVKWAGTATPSLRALEAEDDLRQLDWMIALNEISLGHPDAGRLALERLVAADAESAGFDYADLRSIGFSGMAEIAAAAGDLAEARRLYARGRDVFADAAHHGAPWSLTVASAYVVVSVRAGAVNDPATHQAVRRLRTQIILAHRLRPTFSDRPVIGSGLLGLAVWLLAPDRADATGAERDLGIELLALSAALAGRQDMPALRWEHARAEAAAAHPEADIGAALSRSRALTLAGAMDRAIVLLADVRLRPVFAARVSTI